MSREGSRNAAKWRERGSVDLPGVWLALRRTTAGLQPIGWMDYSRSAATLCGALEGR